MKKQLLSQILSLALVLQTASPLAWAKIIPQEEENLEKIQTQTFSDSDPWAEIATLSLAEQLALSQFVPIAGDPVELGTEATPFLLSNVAQLLELGDYVYDGNEDFNAAHYKLTQDVSLSSVESWAPIGAFTSTSDNAPFQGTFDGDGHVISDATIVSSDDYQGFFGYTKGATIKNLGIENCSVTGKSSVGGLVGYANTSTRISNCYATGTVTGRDMFTGGLVGRADSCTVQNSYATGKVTGSSNITGGLVGFAFGGTISNAYATGVVTGTNQVGGLVGYANGATISNSYATGAVTGSTYNVGGLVGNSRGTIKNSVALNPSVSGASPVNRVLGLNDTASLTNNYAWSGMKVTGGSGSPDAATVWGEDLTFDFSGLSKQFSVIFGNNTAWDYTENGLPTLKDVGGTQSSALPSYMNYTDTIEYIYTVNDLIGFAATVQNGTGFDDPTYILMNDLDMTGVSWTPVGQYGGVFSDTFDGNGYVISNLTITGSADKQGFFGHISDATIKNLGLENCSVSGGSSVGALVGYAESNSVISNCYATGTVTGTFSVGGLVGGANASNITNCYTSVTTTGTTNNVGGLVGMFTGNNITNCYATGVVKGDNVVGGLAGFSYSSTIQNSVALNPSVSGGSYVNRVVGMISGATLSGNYAWRDMTVDNFTVSGGALDDANGLNLTYSSGALSKQFSTIFGDISPWTYTENGLPILTTIRGNQSSALPSYITSTAVVDNPIYTVADLQALATWVNASSSNDTSGKTYTLMNDLDLSGVEWTPIGASGRTFKGIFDGNGKVISNLTITGTDSNQGLFGETEGAEIKNLGIENCSVTGGWYTSGLVAVASDTNIEKCYVTGMVSGGVRVGGLVAQSSTSLTISNCYVTASVSGSSQVGGLIGFVFGNVTIQNCYTTGALSGNSQVGGLVAATANSLTITNSLALNPSVKGTSSVGRVVGNNANTTLSNNYAWKDMQVNNVTVTGAENDQNGGDLSVIDGFFVDSNGGSIYDDTTIFDTSIWNIPSASSGNYMLLPSLKNVGNDKPSIYLVQTIPSEVTVTFDVDGGSTVDPIKTEGNKIDPLPTTTKADYVFGGWYLERGFNTNVTTTTEFSADTTVYAKWLEIPTASDFVFAAPSDLVYDGSGKVATVTSATVTGTITQYYEGINGTSYTKSDTAPSDVGEYQVFIDVTADGSYTAGSNVTDTGWKFIISAKDISSVTFSSIADQTYTGSPHEPSFTVTDGSEALDVGTDFNTVTYSNNTNVGQATVTISGMGNYTGTATGYFTINPTPVTSLDLSNDITPPVKGATPDTTNVSNTQYTGTVTWSPSDSPFLAGTVYTATVTLTPTNNYTFTGVSGDSFSYTGATTVTNSADSGVVSIVFPQTLDKSLMSIAVSTQPTKTAYVYGEDFVETGMEITATYDDGSTAVVSDYTISGNTNLQVTDTKVAVSHTEGGVIQTTDVRISVGKTILTKDNFTYTAPSDLVYDGTGKEARVEGVIFGTLGKPSGSVTVKYYDSGNNPITNPSDVGTYTVTIDVVTDANFDAISGLTDGAWTFAITQATYPDTKTATGSAKYGQSGTVDLSTWESLTGATLTVGTVSDTDNILDGSPTLSGNSLSFAMDSDSSKVGKTATVTIPVTSTNYHDFNLVVTLTMVSSPPASFSVKTGENAYTEKDVFDPTGLEILVTLQDGSTETVAYSGNESKFSFDPALGTPFAPSDTTVKITYEGLTVSYPITVTPIYDLSGTVYDSDKTTKTEGATVTLYQNGKSVGTAQTTSADGAFSFLDVSAGIYNLVATKSDLTKTVLVILDHNREEAITMPSEGVSSAVTLPSGGDVLAVGGVDEVAEEEAEKENLQTGDKIDVSLSVEVTTLPANKVEITTLLAEENLTEGDNIAVTWLEINLAKTVTPSRGSAVTSAVTETDTLLEIVVDLPVDSQGKSGYAVYREHDGAVDILYLGSSGERIELSADKTMLTLYAQKFSTYALVVSEVTITDPDTGSTPSPSPSVPEDDDNDSGSTGGTTTPSSSVTYPVLKISDHGTATISPERVAQGKTVTITVTPDEGYELDFISVVDANKNVVTVRKNEDGTYSFTQPIAKVTIEVVFKESEQEPEEETPEIFPEQLFHDVKTTDWFYPYVKFALEHELMAGMGNGRFAPDDETLRGMIVTMLYSLAEKPMPKTMLIFDDVKTTDYFYLPCLWANQNGIVAGIGNNLFAPYRAVTREEICAILYKYALSETDLVTGYPPDSSFTDGDSISSWAREAVNWCNANDIATGRQGGYFAPKDSAKRSEIATMLTKFVLLLEN